MARRNKYRPGPVIGSIAELDACIRRGDYIYMRISPRRPKHPGILMSMQLRVLQQYVDHGSLRMATPNTDPQE